MYGREYDGKELRFEASGGLTFASLIMQDKETDSYWSIMRGEGVAGEFEGTPLEELPHGEKVQWKDWVGRHPETLVLSVDGREHDGENPYDRYYAMNEGFRGLEAADDRLPMKESIYAFRRGDAAYAAPHATFENGAVFLLDGHTVFLHRPAGASMHRSTAAFIASGEGAFAMRDGRWTGPGGATFDADAGRFVGGDGGEIERLGGLDTLWLNWSNYFPATTLLGGS